MYNINRTTKMRTTIEIPDSLQKKLILEAAENNQKGFSKIVVYALDEYFKKKDSKEKKLRGTDLKKYISFGLITAYSIN